MSSWTHGRITSVDTNPLGIQMSRFSTISMLFIEDGVLSFCMHPSSCRATWELIRGDWLYSARFQLAFDGRQPALAKRCGLFVSWYPCRQHQNNTESLTLGPLPQRMQWKSRKAACERKKCSWTFYSPCWTQKESQSRRMFEAQYSYSRLIDTFEDISSLQSDWIYCRDS